MENVDCEALIFVVPCFNDNVFLRESLAAIPAESKVIVVDDGGNSPTSVQDLPDSIRERTTIIRHPINMGQGAAIETGIEFIRRIKSKSQDIYVVTFDADGQHQIEDVIGMYSHIRSTDIDVVLGSRFLNENSNSFQGGTLKYIILKFSILISRFTLRMPITDRHNGLRIFSGNAIEKIRITQNGYGHADEILREIKRNKLSFAEFPVTIVYPTFKINRGQSLLNSFNIVLKRFLGAR